MITMFCSIVSGSCTGTGSAYVSTTTINGVEYSATSRHGSNSKLARILVEAGVPDAPVEITFDNVAGHMSYRSLHAMAIWTYTEGNSPLSRTRYVKFDRGAVAGEAGIGEETADVLPEPPGGNASVDAPPISVTCEGCGQSFAPKRSDARTCGPTCRKRVSRKLAA